eukprot:XP_020397455.1 proline-rich protein 36-like [Zea mays]
MPAPSCPSPAPVVHLARTRRALAAPPPCPRCAPPRAPAAPLARPAAVPSPASRLAHDPSSRPRPNLQASATPSSALHRRSTATCSSECATALAPRSPPRSTAACCARPARPPARQNAPPRSTAACCARPACLPARPAPPPPARPRARLRSLLHRRLLGRRRARLLGCLPAAGCSAAPHPVVSCSPARLRQPPRHAWQPLSFRPARYSPGPAPPVTVVASVYLLDGAAMEL